MPSGGRAFVLSNLQNGGLVQGDDEDEALARGLGLASADALSDVQRKYAERVKAKLAEQVAAAAEAVAARERLFTAGKRAYEYGQYPASVELLRSALDTEGPLSPLGGEIQLWLALGLQACGQERECIDLYKSLEATHPSAQIRKQAGQLRFILEAPRLKLRPDERVSVPVLESGGRFVPERGNYARAHFAAPPPIRRQRPKTLEERFIEEWRPPRLFPNRYVAVAAVLLALGLACQATAQHSQEAAKNGHCSHLGRGLEASLSAMAFGKTLVVLLAALAVAAADKTVPDPHDPAYDPFFHPTGRPASNSLAGASSQTSPGFPQISKLLPLLQADSIGPNLNTATTKVVVAATWDFSNPALAPKTLFRPNAVTAPGRRLLANVTTGSCLINDACKEDFMKLTANCNYVFDAASAGLRANLLTTVAGNTFQSCTIFYDDGTYVSSSTCFSTTADAPTVVRLNANAIEYAKNPTTAPGVSGLQPGTRISPETFFAANYATPSGFLFSIVFRPIQSFGVYINEELQAFYAYPPERAFAGQLHQLMVAEEELLALKAARESQSRRDRQAEAGQEAVVGSLDMHAVRALPGEVLIGNCANAAYLANVCCAAEARRRGVGAALLAHARELAADWGVEGLYVHIMAANSAARMFYTGLGFVIEAEEGANAAAVRGHCLDGASGAGRTLLLRDAALRRHP
ncbi:hypothetical protein WJX81_000090 [Elliptochloris bilobata]|uniref:N-acetyltransferase domain-containing protein n=1 Tax=Elliptochloris bilobata TaxID=381761 RepID=A0AAW1REI0_9CHLO